MAIEKRKAMPWDEPEVLKTPKDVAAALAKKGFPVSKEKNISMEGAIEAVRKVDSRFKTATKTRVTIFIDDDVLAFFRESGRFYQTRMNAILRKHMENERD